MPSRQPLAAADLAQLNLPKLICSSTCFQKSLQTVFKLDDLAVYDAEQPLARRMAARIYVKGNRCAICALAGRSTPTL